MRAGRGVRGQVPGTQKYVKLLHEGVIGIGSRMEGDIQYPLHPYKTRPLIYHAPTSSLLFINPKPTGYKPRPAACLPKTYHVPTPKLLHRNPKLIQCTNPKSVIYQPESHNTRAHGNNGIPLIVQVAPQEDHEGSDHPRGQRLTACWYRGVYLGYGPTL